MRLLLDTQVFLWFLDDEGLIPERQRAAIHPRENAVLVSAAAIWETTATRSTG